MSKMCLLCDHIFSNEAMKPSRLQEHLFKNHPDKASKDPTTNIMKASYNIVLLMAKSGDLFLDWFDSELFFT